MFNFFAAAAVTSPWFFHSSLPLLWSASICQGLERDFLLLLYRPINTLAVCRIISKFFILHSAMPCVGFVNSIFLQPMYAFNFIRKSYLGLLLVEFSIFKYSCHTQFLWVHLILFHFCFLFRWLSSRDDDGQIIRDLPVCDVLPGITYFDKVLLV